MYKKINYFYIDESGHINNNSNVFIHGCIKTDSPEEINKSISNLKENIFNDIYFDDTVAKKKLENNGFHAVDNHPDVRAEFYKILPLLNFRAYFVLLNKSDEYFKKLRGIHTPAQIFLITLRKLLINRIVRNKHDKNIFYFEIIDFEDTSLNKILNDFFNSLKIKNLNIEYHVVSKKNINLSVIDYLNYILFKLLENKDYIQRMKENFKLIKPKIGSINVINYDTYFSRKTNIELNNILKAFGGG